MVSIIIIAAGASKRMGQPKQLLEWQNTTLLGHSIEQALASQAKSVFVVLGANYDAISASIESYKVNVLRYEDWEKGMGSTIAFAVNKLTESFNHNESAKQAFNPTASSNGLLIMLADQPHVTSDFLNSQINAFLENEHRIIATEYAESVVGVPAVFDAVYFDHLMALRGDKGAKKLINQHMDDVFAIRPPRQLIDIDTKETYLSLQHQLDQT